MRLITALSLALLAACSSVSVKPDNGLKDIPSGAVIPKVSMAKVAIAEPLERPSKIIGVSAASPEPFLGWSKASVGFAKGEVTPDQLQALGIDPMYSWRVLTKWEDGSVRVGQIKFVAYLNGMGLVPVEIKDGKTPYRGFKFHPAVADAVAQDTFGSQLRFRTQVNTVPVVCVPVAGQYKFLYADDTELQVRFRSQCVYLNGAVSPLSMTSIVTLFSEDPVIRLQGILGNDVRENALGTMTMSPLTIEHGTLPAPKWAYETSQGSKAPVLGDGQTWSFKLVFAMDPNFESTARHIQSGEPFGFHYYPEAQASKAFGDLPTTRVAISQIPAAHSQVNQQATLPASAHPQSYAGMVNLNPGATGDQPDFAATQPPEIQKATQAYSSKQMGRVLASIYKESFRPSFFWETRNGVVDRVSAVNYPELFWWSGRPHFHFSWNEQYPEWRSRTSNRAGFWPGEWSGWNSMDNQHYTHNHLRQAWLLTGDPYLEEVLKYYVSMTYWNYYTDWLPNIEAERAFGRTQKEAILLTQMFPDLQESVLLGQKLQIKAATHRAMVSSRISAFNHTGGSLFDGCDGRVNNAVWCPTQQAINQGPIVVVGWMTGFVQEALMLGSVPDLRYLAAAQEYFLNDGTPKTYHLINDPNQFITGGVGIQWWAPWVSIALKNPSAPGAAFVLEKVKPVIDARMQQGCVNGPWFCLNDGWLTW